jgi:hypothetical protein
MIFGALVAVDGAVTEPFQWWNIGIGVFLGLIGLRWFLRPRAATPPAI